MADRYVNYDKLLEARHRLGLDEMSKIHKVNAFNHFIDNIPTADVVEVKHGEWKEDTEFVITDDPDDDGWWRTVYICSNCGRIELRKERYCHCGAKMDGVKNV